MISNVGLRRNIKYCAMQGIYWMISCSCIVFAAVFLKNYGYSDTEYGVIMAAGYILGMILQPIVSSAADRAVRITPTAFLAFTCIAVAGSVAGLLLFPQKGIALTVCFVLFLAFQLVLQPLVNAYCFYLETPDAPIHFGIARGTGSITWGISSAVIGILADRFGAEIVPYIALLFIALMLILLFLCHLEGPIARKTSVQAQEKSMLTLKTLTGRYRLFLFLLLGNLFLFFGHSQIDNYPLQIINNVGGSASDMGIFCAYAALLEFPAMFLFSKLAKRFSFEKLLCFSAVMFLLKGILMVLVQTLAGVYLANAFQAISFAIFVPAAVRYAGERTDPRDANKAQSLVTATTTAGNILSSAFGGVMIDTISVKGMLLVGAAASFAGLGFILLMLAKKKNLVRNKR